MRTLDLILHGADRALDAAALYERRQCSVTVVATSIEYNARMLRAIDSRLAGELGDFAQRIRAADGDVLATGDVLDALRAWRRKMAAGSPLRELAPEDEETEEVVRPLQAPVP